MYPSPLNRYKKAGRCPAFSIWRDDLILVTLLKIDINSRAIHQLDVGHGGLVAGAVAALEDADIATGPRLVARAEQRFKAQPFVATKGELTPLYRGGPGSWEMRLSRDRFTIREIRGDVDWLYLACLGSEKRLPFPSLRPWEIPAGWRECKVEISGRAGTRFELHQLAPGASSP